MAFFKNEVIEGIWKDRYQKNNETIDDNLRRVARYCAKDREQEEEFYHVMNEKLFYPAGRTMSNSGIGKELTLNNCFTANIIDDSLDAIFDKVKLGAKTHQRGGGIGYSFGGLRPRGTETSNDAIASGPVSFMDVFNAQTATIEQGSRRGANMGVLPVYHPDIVEFVNAKSYETGKLNQFNISVMVDNDFMNAVKKDENIFLHFPVYNEDGSINKDESSWKIKKEVSAKEIWDMIIKRAYDNGEPGVLFYENMNDDNNLKYIEKIVCTNPCAEYLAGSITGTNPLNGEKLNPNDFGGACNLGSLFLHNFVINPFKANARIDYDKLKETVKIAVKFLDRIIDINKFPDKIYENYQRSFRTIGLGITGLADMLAMLNLRYDSKEACEFVDKLLEEISATAYEASIDLAIELGEFPFINRFHFIESGYIHKHSLVNPDRWAKITNNILKWGIRNSKILCVAPTGTLSLTFGNNCSSGLEPIFSLSYDRKIRIGGQSDDNEKIVTMSDFAYDEWLKVKDEPDTVVTKDCFIVALDMAVDDHLTMLETVAYHMDMSCSKTINIPTDYSFEDTKNVYMRAWESGIKGCTIFRPNEIRQGILISDSKKENKFTPLKRGDVIKVDDNVVGRKRKLITGCGSLHCEAYFDPETGSMLETYFNKGSKGGCNNFMIALSRIISYALRVGGSVEDIKDQLDSCGTCPSYAVRTATRHDTSKGSCCPTAIGNALVDMYKTIINELDFEDSPNESEPVKPKTTKKQSQQDLIMSGVCPECGEPIIHEGGCVDCKSCGWSKCS